MSSSDKLTRWSSILNYEYTVYVIPYFMGRQCGDFIYQNIPADSRISESRH